MQSQIDVLDSHRWIFVNYVPGSFGSFLTKILEHSDSVSGIKNKEFFNKDAASHNTLTRWIRKWHHGDDLDRWLSLPLQEQRQFLLDSISYDLLKNVSDQLRMVHRLTMPKMNQQFMQYWPNAKFVVITLDEKNLPLVIDQMVKKTFKIWLKTRLAKSDILATILSNNNISSQLKFYRKECEKRIRKTMVQKIELSHRIFQWPVACFLDQLLFQQRHSDLTQWLGIQPYNVTELYQLFANLHRFGEPN